MGRKHRCPKHNVKLKVLKDGVHTKQTHKDTFYCPVEGCAHITSVYKSFADFVEG